MCIWHENYVGQKCYSKTRLEVQKFERATEIYQNGSLSTITACFRINI